MIDRYSRPEMREIWSDDGRYRRWLEVELAVCEVHAERGLIPADALETIRAKAAVDPARVAEIEAKVRHDVIAFLTNVAENVGPASRFVHYGMTSSDVLDTALALQVRDAGALVLEAAWSWFPAGTVHVVVVDPEVGTERDEMSHDVDEPVICSKMKRREVRAVPG